MRYYLFLLWIIWNVPVCICEICKHITYVNTEHTFVFWYIFVWLSTEWRWDDMCVFVTEKVIEYHKRRFDRFSHHKYNKFKFVYFLITHDQYERLLLSLFVSLLFVFWCVSWFPFLICFSDFLRFHNGTILFSSQMSAEVEHKRIIFLFQCISFSRWKHFAVLFFAFFFFLFTL